ncbi:MAG: hypothetical protein ACI4OE_04310 [Alphaproteobacteria bacterium]
MRKNIFEILESRYNTFSEFVVIEQLFNSPLLIDNRYYVNGNQTTIVNAVNNTCFYKWKQRGTCLTAEDMMKKLDLTGLKALADEGKICKLEYICNMVYLVNTNLFSPQFTKTYEFFMFEQNIKILLEHLNYEEHVFDEDEKVILIPKNPAATAVAEISSEDTAMAILMYHHASLEGKLAEKKDILRRIAQEYEPTLDKPIEGFTDYFKTANNMLNNLDIRHNNRDGKNKKELVLNLTDLELENWYDELYQLLLFCVLIKDNKERKDNMSEFLKGLKEHK